MRTIRGFIAASLDGYVADAAGGVDWLNPFDDIDFGYEAFIAGIGIVVLGRATYDQIPSFGMGWPYPDRRGLVVTSRPLDIGYPDVTAWHDGVPSLVGHLREGADLPAGDVWVVGGARLQAAFIAAGALDRLDLFVIPVLLGDGVPLFPKAGTPSRELTLEDTQTYPKGMVRLSYTLT